MHSLFTKALQLSEPDRIELASLLVSSVIEQEQQAVRQAWMEEVDRRRAAFLQGEVQTIAYDEVMFTARARAAS